MTTQPTTFQPRTSPELSAMADSLLRDCGDGLLDSESGAHAIHIIADPTGTTDLVQAIARITLTAATHIDVPFNQIILAAGRSITTRLLDKRRLKLDAPRTAPLCRPKDAHISRNPWPSASRSNRGYE